MKDFKPAELAQKLNIAINYNPKATGSTLSYEDYVIGLVASKLDLPKFIVQDMTDSEFNYYLDSSTENFIKLQKETIIH